MNDTTPEIFYTKLLSAMEAGLRKKERSILENLADHFHLKGEKDLRSSLIKNVPPEDAMVWLLSEIQPFAAMLNDIYRFLANSKASILGNSDQFSFRFDKFNERVAFPLDSFPKTYTKALSKIKVLTTRFNPAARGHFLTDPPNHWTKDVLAIYYLTHSLLIRPDPFGMLPSYYKKKIHSCVQTIIDNLEAKYVFHDFSEDEENLLQANFVQLYFADQNLLNEFLRILQKSNSQYENGQSDEVNQFINNSVQAGSIIYGDMLYRFLQSSAEYLDTIPDNEPQKFNSQEGEHLFNSFMDAFDLCFQASPSIVEDYIDVIDKVFLPFYRHRWRLFEIWAILWTIEAIPKLQRPEPKLSPRTDNSNSYEWIIPGGDAKEPVAVWEKDGKALELWYQQKTPLTTEQAAKFKQKNIEPDVRVRGGDIGHTKDLAILELKDRFNASGSHEKKIARMYATTGAHLVCVANYSKFGSLYLQGKIYREQVGNTAIMLVDEFKPGKVPQEAAKSFTRAVNGFLAEFAILADVSVSINLSILQQTFQTIVALGVSPARLFSFANNLKELPIEVAPNWSSGGGTNLISSLKEYISLSQVPKIEKVVILTDEDGLTQFTTVKEVKEFAELNILCLNLNEELNSDKLVKWLNS